MIYCQSCMFWLREKHGSHVAATPEKPAHWLPADYGECRRKSPQLRMGRDDEDCLEVKDSRWPKTYHDDGCGEGEG